MQPNPSRPAPRFRRPGSTVLTLAACLGIACLAQLAPAAEPAAAPAKTTHTVSWKSRLEDSGTTGLVQIALSVFGAGFVFERLFNLRRKHVVPAGLASHARQLWRDGNFGELEVLGETQPSTLARTISFIAKNRRAPMADVSEICGELVSRELAQHHQRAYPLGIIASLGPLLGLLGMILGMIETFEIVSAAGSLGDPTQLASGISEALVTTGLGLAIAIPFLTLYHVFKYRTANFGMRLEEEVTGLLNAWLLQPAGEPEKPKSQRVRTEAPAEAQA